MITLILSVLTIVCFGAGIAWAKAHNDTIADGFIRIYRDEKDSDKIHVHINVFTNPFILGSFCLLVGAAVAGIFHV